MADITVQLVQAFASKPPGGNGAGVVLDAQGLSAADCQKIAAQIGLSETAFVFPSEQADGWVRFFTPTQEVSFCGHATVATFHALHQLAGWKPGRYTQQTQAGLLSVEIAADGVILQSQSLPEFGLILDAHTQQAVLASLNLPESALCAGWPLQVVSTGLNDLIVPLANDAALNDLKPDFQAIERLSEQWDVIGYHVFCLSEEETSSGPLVADCRNFAPRFGILEESATGSASGALACYLHTMKGLTGRQSFQFHQGEVMGRSSIIDVQLETAGANDIQQVRVLGPAYRSGTRVISL